MSGLILPYDGVLPTIAEDVFIAPNATVIGHVTIGAGSSIWFGTTLRGDIGEITIGERTNLQDATIVHVTQGRFDTHIGSDVLIGHNAIIHGATLEDGCFIGMRATVLDGAVIESRAMVAAGALITPGKRVKTGELWAGSPARLMRQLSPEEMAGIQRPVDSYHRMGQRYRQAFGS